MQQWYGVQKIGNSTETVKELYNNCKGTVTETVNTKETLKETTKEPLPHIREAIGFYSKLYTEKTGIKPAWEGRLVKLLKADLTRLSAPEWKELVESFFRSPPDFVTKNSTGFAYNIFHSQIDRMVVRGALKKKVVKRNPGCPECGKECSREFGYWVCPVHGRKEELG